MKGSVSETGSHGVPKMVVSRDSLQVDQTWAQDWCPVAVRYDVTRTITEVDDKQVFYVKYDLGDTSTCVLPIDIFIDRIRYRKWVLTP